MNPFHNDFATFHGDLVAAAKAEPAEVRAPVSQQWADDMQHEVHELAASRDRARCHVSDLQDKVKKLTNEILGLQALLTNLRADLALYRSKETDQAKLLEGLRDGWVTVAKAEPDDDMRYWESYFRRLTRVPEDLAVKVREAKESRNNSSVDPKFYSNRYG